MKTPKAQLNIRYEPHSEIGKKFWEDQWVLSKLVDVLKARGGEVDGGADLRVIMVMDDGTPGIYIQGKELLQVYNILREYDPWNKKEEEQVAITVQRIQDASNALSKEK